MKIFIKYLYNENERITEAVEIRLGVRLMRYPNEPLACFKNRAGRVFQEKWSEERKKWRMEPDLLEYQICER